MKDDRTHGKGPENRVNTAPGALKAESPDMFGHRAPEVRNYFGTVISPGECFCGCGRPVTEYRKGTKFRSGHKDRYWSRVRADRKIKEAEKARRIREERNLKAYQFFKKKYPGGLGELSAITDSLYRQYRCIVDIKVVVGIARMRNLVRVNNNLLFMIKEDLIRSGLEKQFGIDPDLARSGKSGKAP